MLFLFWRSLSSTQSLGLLLHRYEYLVASMFSCLPKLLIPLFLRTEHKGSENGCDFYTITLRFCMLGLALPFTGFWKDCYLSGSGGGYKCCSILWGWLHHSWRQALTNLYPGISVCWTSFSVPPTWQIFSIFSVPSLCPRCS
jgi:hypothetical protein